MSLYKIAQDVRFLASRSRSGFGEITIPANKPGSSIMLGRTNPTQCNGKAMICGQVTGHDAAIFFSEPRQFLNWIHLEQYWYKTLFSQMIRSFDIHCDNGIGINKDRMNRYVRNSLMLVTTLADHIGYEKSSEIAKSDLK